MNQVLDHIHCPMSLWQFSFLSKSSAYVQPTEPLATPSSSNDSAQSKLSKYAAELEEQSHRPGPEQKPLSFWHDHHAVFPILTPIAEDLTAAPASQA